MSVEIDTVLSDSEERDYVTTESDWETLYHFPILMGGYQSLKLWIQAKAIGGGTAHIRIQITDVPYGGSTEYESDGISTVESSYDGIGPDTRAFPDIISPNQLWRVNIQGKIVGGTSAWATGGTHQRYAST